MGLESGFPKQDPAEKLLLEAHRCVDAIERPLIESEESIRSIEDELQYLTGREKSLATAPEVDLLKPGAKDPKEEYESIQERFAFLKSKLAELELRHKELLLAKKAYYEKLDRDFPNGSGKQFEILVQNLLDHSTKNELPDIQNLKN
jgi:uncharacterized coiled-coil DUF342 family protein